MNSFSDKIIIPIFFAFSTLEPVFCPATKWVVFFVKEFFVNPPAFSTFFLASFLFISSRVPVKAKIVLFKCSDVLILGFKSWTPFCIQLFTGVNFYKDLFFEQRTFNRDEDYLIEFYNGIELFGYQNYNFGRRISSNHNLRYSLKFFNREVAYEPDSLDVFNEFPPQSGGEGSLSFTYIFSY